MACGYGACYGCAVEIDGELKRLCIEGPVLQNGGTQGSPVGPLLNDQPRPCISVGCARAKPGSAARRPLSTERQGFGLRLLNASGCLDALTAPDVARSLDAFVSKTVTPLPREGNPPVRIAETEAGMLNSIGLANPGRDRFLAENLPRLRELGVPLWISVGGFSAHEYAETCAQLEDVTVELNLSCPNVEEGAHTGRRDRRRLPCSDDASALRKALAGQLGRRRGGPRRGRCGRRRTLTRQHHSRPQARRAVALADPGSGARRLLRPCAQADCARRRLLLPHARSTFRSSGWEASVPVAT